MKHSSYLLSLLFLIILASCSNNDEPQYPIFMQPSSITTDDTNGGKQTFEYDDYGKIRQWSLKYSDNEYVTAQYTYPDDNTIKIKSEEMSFNNRTNLEETILLVNGRASKSEGTYISEQNGNTLIRKTYRLEFEYAPDNHLTTVKNAEVVGIGDELKSDAWGKAWIWENYLIWEDGNLKEFQNYFGKSYVFQSTRYEYYTDTVVYPVIIPVVFKFHHHSPLFMQGVFGLNSNNQLKTSAVFDKDGNYDLSRQYVYGINAQGLVDNYTETLTLNTAHSTPILYKVDWTASQEMMLAQVGSPHAHRNLLDMEDDE